MMKNLTEKQFKIIEKEVDKFNSNLGIMEIDYGDVIYTYFNPGQLLNDWIECNDKYENDIVDCINKIASNL